LGLLAASPSFAEVQVQFTPNLTLEQSFTDNFFLEEQNEVNMWVTRVAPGFNLKTKTEKSIVLINYMVGHYWHYTDEVGIKASDQNFFRHDLSIGAASQLSPRWRLGFTEELVSSREPLLSETELPEGVFPDLIDVATRIDFTRNRIKPFINHSFSDKWDARLNYRHETFDLSSTDPIINSLIEDQKENRGLVAITYNLNTGNHLDLEQQYWHRDFKAADPSDPVNSDYDAYQAMLIYRREMKGSPYKFEIGAGYQFRNFVQDIPRGGGRFERMDNLSEFVSKAEISRIAKTNKIRLALERAINDFTISNNYYTSNGVKLLTEKTFEGSGFLLFGGGGYEFNKYLTDPREDNVWELQMGAGYRFLESKLELRLGYEYNDRESNLLDASYTENKAFFKLEAKHDIAGKW
jgi:hypothetical protein